METKQVGPRILATQYLIEQLLTLRGAAIEDKLPDPIVSTYIVTDRIRRGRSRGYGTLTLLDIEVKGRYITKTLAVLNTNIDRLGVGLVGIGRSVLDRIELLIGLHLTLIETNGKDRRVLTV